MLDQLMSYAWHDVRILDITIDRRNAGKRDIVRLSVEWAEGKPRPSESRSMIEFIDCYRLEAALNMGVAADESVRAVWLEPDHPDIARLQTFFGVANLFCWVLETNSTGSIIRIVAKAAAIAPLPLQGGPLSGFSPTP